MSDYRDQDFNYRSPEDPMRRDAKFDPDTRAVNAAWGWVAAAVFLVVVLAVAFGIGGRPGQSGQLGTNTAANDTMPPAASHMAPPGYISPSTITPAPTSPAPATATAPAVTPAPNTPAPQGAASKMAQ
jgi:hypothetical protein